MAEESPGTENVDMEQVNIRIESTGPLMGTILFILFSRLVYLCFLIKIKILIHLLGK